MKMELFWSRPKCDSCKHRTFVNPDKNKIGNLSSWGCGARQANIVNNKYYNRLKNCWYYEKK